MPSFRKYIEKRIQEVESWLALPSDETDWQSVAKDCRSLLADVQKQATIEGVPEAVTACRLSGRITIQDTRRILAECLVACPSDQKPIDPVLLTVKQAAARYNMGERTLYRLLEFGDLRNCGHGRSKRIKPVDLECYLEDQGQPQAAPESLFG
jgi:excisionase family DNA binding protein